MNTLCEHHETSRRLKLVDAGKIVLYRFGRRRHCLCLERVPRHFFITTPRPVSLSEPIANPLVYLTRAQ